MEEEGETLMIHSMTRIVTDRVSLLLDSLSARMTASVRIVKINRNSDLTTAKGLFVHKSRHTKTMQKQIIFQQEKPVPKNYSSKMYRQHLRHCIIIAKSLVLVNSSTASPMLYSMHILSKKVNRAVL